jgi:outer membrane autotransporter protein
MAFIASLPGWAGVIDDDTARTPAPALRCSVRRHGWQIEPQSQLIYQGFDFSSLNNGAANVSFSDLASLAGRICGRLSRLWEMRTSPSDAPRTVSVWGVANLWHEFLGQPATSFPSADGPVPSIANLRDSWGEIGLGASVQVSARASLFGSVDYASTFA